MFILVPLFATSFALADVQIQDVVPESTILVISTSDVGKVITHLQDSGVCDTISEVASSVKELSGSDSCSFGSTECTEILGQLGIDKETWTPPNGDAGFALYPVVDYEVGSVGIGYLGMIELDDPLYDNLFSEKFEEFVGNAEVEYETVSLSGRDVWMFDYSLPATAPVPSLNIDPNAFSRTYLVYSDGYLIFGSEPDAIASAFSAIDGEPENGTLASNADYLSMLDICGTDGDVFAAVLLTNLADTIMQIDSSGMAMMFLPTLKAAVGDIDGIAESVTISPSSDVFIEATYTALMNDGRSGLMGLIGENTTSESMPSFVAPDALSYSQCQINLSKFTTLIKETMMSNPMLGMQMAGQMEQMEAGFDLFFNPLGSTVHSFSTGRLPFTDESVGYLVAIECTDEEAFGNALGATLPMMGATPSDFLGNQLFTIDFSSAMPMPLPYPLEMSLAVGGGYAFIGTTHTVESALRSIANPKTSKNNLVSNAALSMLSNEDVSSWGFSDLKKSIEFQTAMSEAMTKDMFDEMEAFDPEMAAEMRAEFDKNSELQTKISDAIGSLIGPMAWNMTVDDTGLTAHAIMLKPKSD
jgi:hypothetical protein